MKSSDPDYDYGIILLPAPDDCNERFAYSTTIEELDKRIVNSNCGYPDDKPCRTMWITGGIMLDLTDRTFFYMDYSIRKHDALITISRKMEAYPMMKLIEYGSLSNDD